MPRSPRTYDITWFLDLAQRGQLNLDPSYQRRSVWSTFDKRFFIDTILHNYPAPPVFLHKTLDDAGRATYHVVDGKQRLQTIIDFTENKIRVPDNFSDDRLRKLRFSDLDQETKVKFWNYEIVVEMLPDVSATAVKEIFERINRNSRKLTQQELRHAKYDGWFVNMAEREGDDDDWRTLGVVTVSRSKRMADVQFISELLLILIDGRIHGFDQDFLDERYAEFEEISDHPTFDLEAFNEKLGQTKGIALSILEHDKALIEFYRIQGHFYTLWAFLFLHREEIRDTQRFADSYKKFMLAVKESLGRTQGESSNIENARGVGEYASSFTGANIDLSPRQRRLDALTQALGTNLT